MSCIKVLGTSRWCSFDKRVLTSGRFIQRGYHCNDSYCHSTEEPGHLSTWCFWKFPPLELVSNTPLRICRSLEHFTLLPASVPITKDKPTSRFGSEGLKWEVLALEDGGASGNMFLKTGTSFRQDALGGSLPLHSGNLHKLLPLLETLVLMKRRMSWV